jgi:hypothetical protein
MDPCNVYYMFIVAQRLRQVGRWRPEEFPNKSPKNFPTSQECKNHNKNKSQIAGKVAYGNDR